LKELAELLDIPGVVERLRSASSREEVIKIIEECSQSKS